MEKEQLQKIIKVLEANNSKDQAYFEVSYTDGEEHGTYIKANNSGLQLFASELLNVALNSEEVLSTNERITHFDSTENWLKGLAFFDYVKIISEKPEENKENEIEDTWKDKALGRGCFAIAIIAIIIFIVGLISTYNYFFNSQV
ncbi:hypothetical protein [Flavobacterium macacae]|uniref:Uncharacterized protein n=1 Tax=Flavobacterium macacae TaxID=2488993 RepID=A0A3P3W473_9FLAO|nr:hypothetical protein [Flavobacterium macacae]RRJ89227.1 hypothetical protein EG849_13235 [Flavobacterium macacae]